MAMPPLPEAFRSKIVGVAGEAGRAWLAQLPAILEELSERWQLQLGHPFEGMAFNYVVPAVDSDGRDLVLKLAPPEEHYPHELAALRAFGGRASVRLVDHDLPLRALLLEGLQPGRPIAELEDEEQANRIAAALAPGLCVAPPPGHSFPDIAAWADGLARLRACFDGGSGPFPERLLQRAEAHYRDLLPSQGPLCLLHGDFHHWNVLSAEDRPQGWAAIDPQGLIGEAEYLLMPWIRNRLPENESPSVLRTLLSRRIEQLAEALGHDPARLRAWSQAEALLSAWWSFEDGSPEWKPDLEIVELL